MSLHKSTEEAENKGWVEFELGRRIRWHVMLAWFGQGYFLVVLFISTGLLFRILWAVFGGDWRGAVIFGVLELVVYLMNKPFLDQLLNLIFQVRKRCRLRFENDCLAFCSGDRIEYFYYRDLGPPAEPLPGQLLWVSPNNCWIQVPKTKIPEPWISRLGANWNKWQVGEGEKHSGDESGIQYLRERYRDEERESG